MTAPQTTSWIERLCSAVRRAFPFKYRTFGARARERDLQLAVAVDSVSGTSWDEMSDGFLSLAVGAVQI